MTDVAPQSTTQTIQEPIYPNAGLRILLMAVEKVMGTNGVNALLTAAGMRNYVNNYPQNNFEFAIKYSEYSRICRSVEDFYGRAQKGMQMRVGKEIFQYGLSDAPAFLGVAGLAMKLMPTNMRVKLLLTNITKTSNHMRVPTELVERDDHYLYVMKACPHCFGRQSEKGCLTVVGMLQAAMQWGTDKTFSISEVECRAMGGASCSYRIEKTPLEM